MDNNDFPSIKRVGIDQLSPWPNNPRTHTEAQISEVIESINEFGYTNPIIVDEDMTILAGHGRYYALQRMGYDVAPVIVKTGLSDAQKRAYVLADNKIAENSEWDSELLRVEMKALDDLNFDITLTGFKLDEINSILHPDEDQYGDGAAGALADAFGVPPFSVINTRDGKWQERKRAWLALGIRSELGRDAGSLPLRAGKQMRSTRKVGKTHQNILVFVKGDGKRAATAAGGSSVQIADDNLTEG